jgi:cytochrome c-type biogenesis protein CcmH
MILWIAIAALSIACAAIVAAPLFRRAPPPPPRESFDLAVYRDQLAELARDRARGLIGESEHAAARVEIERRALAAADRARPGAPTASIARVNRGRLAAAELLAAALPVAATLVYLSRGAPHLLEATAPTRGENEIANAIERLVGHLERNPDDAEGWAMLGRSFALLARHGEAERAYAEAERLAPRNADVIARRAETRIFADGGAIGAEARAMLDRALAADGKDPRARYYRGLALSQSGQKREALEAWLALQRDSPVDAPWREPLARSIDELVSELGLDPGQLGSAAPAPRGPTAEDVAAAARMSSEERAAMIRGMVDGLAERLAREPNDAAGWMRLGRAYEVLGESERARDAWQRAAELKPDDRGALAGYARSMLAAAGAGMPPPEFTAVASALLAAAPEAPEALWFGGIAARANGDAATAARMWRSLRARLPEGAPLRAEVERALASLEKSEYPK